MTPGELAAQDQIARQSAVETAATARGIYVAFRAEGFSDDQAFTLVCQWQQVVLEAAAARELAFEWDEDDALD